MQEANFIITLDVSFAILIMLSLLSTSALQVISTMIVFSSGLFLRSTIDNTKIKISSIE